MEDTFVWCSCSSGCGLSLCTFALFYTCASGTGLVGPAHCMWARVFDASSGATNHLSSDGAALAGDCIGQFCARLGAEGLLAGGPYMLARAPGRVCYLQIRLLLEEKIRLLLEERIKAFEAFESRISRLGW